MFTACGESSASRRTCLQPNVSTLVRLLEMLTCPDIEVTDIHKINEEMMMVTSRLKAEFVNPSGQTNVVIAAFTTGLVRLKLLSLLERVGHNALYMDTDSVIFIWQQNFDPLHDLLGENLGEITNEIGKGHYHSLFRGAPRTMPLSAPMVLRHGRFAVSRRSSASSNTWALM